MACKKLILHKSGNHSQKHFEEAFKEFIVYCQAKNLSIHTIEFYRYTYGELNKYVADKSLTTMQELTESIFQDFIISLQARIANPISVNTILRGCRAFIYYCMRLDYLKQFKIQTIKAEKKIKATYTDAELEILLKKPNLKTCGFTEYRDWVVVNYLLGTGNRLSSILNLKVKDINLEEQYVLVEKTKNKRQQFIPLSRTLVKVLQEYLCYRKGGLEDFLFCSDCGQQLKSSGLTNTIARYNRIRGVCKTSIHLFRHTFAKKWILAGGDIFRLQKVLGHSSLEIVKEYVNMFNDDLKQDFDKFNPLEQMASHNEFIKMR